MCVSSVSGSPADASGLKYSAKYRCLNSKQPNLRMMAPDLAPVGHSEMLLPGACMRQKSFFTLFNAAGIFTTCSLSLTRSRQGRGDLFPNKHVVSSYMGEEVRQRKTMPFGNPTANQIAGHIEEI